MAEYFNARRRISILIFLFLFLFACATYSMSAAHSLQRAAAVQCRLLAMAAAAAQPLVCCLCAVCSNYYLMWIVLAIGLGVLIIVDFMFLTEDTFVYDPNYKSWGIKTGGAY